MGEIVDIHVPHQLGKVQARERIAGGVDKLSEFIPGGNVTEEKWVGDALHMTIEAMGQRVRAVLDVRETEVYGEFDLPPMLAMFANAIKGKLQKEAPKMLE